MLVINNSWNIKQTAWHHLFKRRKLGWLYRGVPLTLTWKLEPNLPFTLNNSLSFCSFFIRKTIFFITDQSCCSLFFLLWWCRRSWVRAGSLRRSSTLRIAPLGWRARQARGGASSSPCPQSYQTLVDSWETPGLLLQLESGDQKLCFSQVKVNDFKIKAAFWRLFYCFVVATLQKLNLKKGKDLCF